MPPTLEELNPELRGLPSFEQARILAEKRRQAQLDAMAELERTVGAPERVGIEGQLRKFTLPSGVKRTFTEAGDLRSFQLPLTSTNDYAPRDKRKIEKLYQDRSAFATDPELTPQERQLGMDKVDAQINRVPHISPLMKEPTAQQKFDAAVVTAPDGSKGTFEPKTGKFIPLESSKQAQELEKEYRTFYGRTLADITKINDAFEENDQESPGVLAEKAKWRADVAFGRIKQRPLQPQLDLLWQGTMTRLQAWGTFDWGKINKDNMHKGMKIFIAEAMEKYGISEAEAKADYMNRWSRANEGGQYHDDLPKLSGTESNQARFVSVTTALESDPKLSNFDDDLSRKYGLRRGEGTVTVDGKTVSTIPLPKEIEQAFPNMDTEDKRAIQQKLQEGWTVQEVMTAIGAS